MSLGYTGVVGGLVIVSADDPNAHSSQNEQDNRIYGMHANIPRLRAVHGAGGQGPYEGALRAIGEVPVELDPQDNDEARPQQIPPWFSAS